MGIFAGVSIEYAIFAFQTTEFLIVNANMKNCFWLVIYFFLFFFDYRFGEHKHQQCIWMVLKAMVHAQKSPRMSCLFFGGMKWLGFRWSDINVNELKSKCAKLVLQVLGAAGAVGATGAAPKQ